MQHIDFIYLTRFFLSKNPVFQGGGVGLRVVQTGEIPEMTARPN